MSLISNTMNRTREGQNREKTHLLDAYKPVLDYSVFEITEEEREQLVKCEKDLLKGKQEFERGSLLMAKALYEAQEALANNKNGVFQKWYESIGLKKTFVYMALKRHSVNLKYKDERVAKLPERVLNEIVKVEEIISRETLEKIIETPKEAKNILFGSRTIYEAPESIEEAELVEKTEVSEEDPDLIRLSQVKKEIRMLRARLDELEAEEKMLEKKKNLKK